MKAGTSFNTSKTLSFLRAIACAALLVATGTQNLRAHDQNLPWDFVATAIAVSEQVDPSDPTHTTEIDIGSGHASHLGVVSVVVHDEVYEIIDPTIGPALSISGEATLTGPDGSTLTFSLYTLLPYNPPTFPFQASIVIISGTGHLSGASGSAEADGYVDETGAFHFEAKGHVTIAKKEK